jgi:acylphosphatase
VPRPGDFVPVPSTSITRATIHYSGHVQGVGFRYAVVQTARGYDVTGFVENLSDGRVVVVAEGEAPEIGQFATAITEQMSGYIRKSERVDEVATRQHRGFSIR